MAYSILKNIVFRTASLLGVDGLFRHVNKEKLLVVMYHGVTANTYDPPVWTQLPVHTFRRHLEFLRNHYVLVSLGEVINAIRNRTPLPERAVLITFDDGLKNNYSVVFPILLEMGIPAAIFLTVDYVGSEEILWVDELYFLLKEAASRGISLDLQDTAAREYLRQGRVWESYEITVEALKRSGEATRNGSMERLRTMIPLNRRKLLEDFGMLDWDEVRAMQRSGLIEFGVHTATHRILAELEKPEWEREIVIPKQDMEKKLTTEIAAFCFPNGRPHIDFRAEHLDYLRNAGYICAFTTGPPLFAWPGDDTMTIGRLAGGNDITSEQAFFRLNASGAIRFVKDCLGKYNGRDQTVLDGETQ